MPLKPPNTPYDGPVVRAQRRLVLIRHAKSAWPEGTDDFHRPLADRGLADAPRVGKWLRKNLPGIEVVLCSPARRTRETWQLAGAEVPASPTVQFDERIYQGSADDLLSAIRGLPSTSLTAVLVGHNPGLEELLSLLTGEPAELKTGSIAVLATSAAWSAAGKQWANVDTFARPRD